MASSVASMVARNKGEPSSLLIFRGIGFSLLGIKKDYPCQKVMVGITEYKFKLCLFIISAGFNLHSNIFGYFKTENHTFFPYLPQN